MFAWKHWFGDLGQFYNYLFIPQTFWLNYMNKGYHLLNYLDLSFLVFTVRAVPSYKVLFSFKISSSKLRLQVIFGLTYPNEPFLRYVLTKSKARNYLPIIKAFSLLRSRYFYTTLKCFLSFSLTLLIILYFAPPKFLYCLIFKT